MHNIGSAKKSIKCIEENIRNVENYWVTASLCRGMYTYTIYDMYSIALQKYIYIQNIYIQYIYIFFFCDAIHIIYYRGFKKVNKMSPKLNIYSFI